MTASDLGAFVSEITGDSHLRVEDDFGGGFVRLKSAEAERRQAKHDIRGSEDVLIELLRNARDAGARNIFVATAREAERRTITVLDDGDGVPDRMREKIFEARVTSKLDTVHMDTWGIHGRGMALYAIKVNALSARVAASKEGGGSSFYVETDVNKLPEKTDQSTRPVFMRSESGTVTVRGPRNICRTVAEFAYVERKGCTVYLGSPIDIAAALWERGRALVSARMRAFCDDPEQVDVCKRLALASSPEDFAHIAHSIGLELSERSARRVMDGSIEPPHPVAQEIVVHDAQKGSKAKRRTASAADRPANAADDASGSGLSGDRIARVMGAQRPLSVRLEPADERALAQAVAQAWQDIAPAYYFEPYVEPRVEVRGGEVRITFPLHRSAE